MKKIILIICGLVLMLLGLIGVVLPILPTVPFLFLASLCFLNSSKRLNEWFKNTSIYKKHVERFIMQKGMTLKAKLSILIPVYVILISLCVLKDNLVMRIAIAILLFIKTIFFIKIKTIKDTTYNAKQTIN